MKFTIASLSAAALLGLGACSTYDSMDKEADMMAEDAMMEKTIVATAASNDDLSTLVAAVQAADLVDTLNSDGPFTVFAPPNAAFNKLPAGTLDTLLKPENKGMLSGILTYHVVAGEVDAKTLTDAIANSGGQYTFSTVNGQSLTAMVMNNAVVLRDAKGNTSTITATDIEASNGVVHLIDTVVMPN